MAALLARGDLSVLLAWVATAWVITSLVCGLGQWVVARLAGFRIHAVSVGRGPRIWTGEVFGIDWTVSLWPVAVEVSATRVEPGAWRLRQALFVGVGPAMLLLLAAVSAWQYPWRVADRGHQSMSFFLAMLMAVSGLRGIVELLPGTRVVNGARTWTQGQILLQLILARKNALEHLLAYQHALRGDYESQRAFDEGDVAGALRIAEERARELPDDPAIATSVVVFRGHLGAVVEAFTELEDILERHPQAEPALRTSLLVSLGYFALIQDQADLADAADKYTRAAITAEPRDVGALRTRGAVLVASGQVAAGERLIVRADRRRQAPWSHAVNASWLGLVARKRGDRVLAEALSESARRQGRGHPVVAQVEAFVARQPLATR